MHANVEPSGAAKLNDGAVLVVMPAGPAVIVVCGATVSTVNERVAGDASMLPEWLARTEKV